MPVLAESVVRPQQQMIAVSLEPVYSALNSLMLVVQVDQLSGLADWVINTHNALAPAELEDHRLVMEGLHYALLPRRNWSNFETYIDWLETTNPIALRDHLVNAYLEIPSMRDEPTPYQSVEQVLSSASNYVDFLVGRFCEDNIDQELEKQAYAYVINPAAMQKMIVSHLRMMWERFLAAEWHRVQPMLADSVSAFRAADLDDMSLEEATLYVTGQQLSDIKLSVHEETLSRIVFVPSAHIGPYLGNFCRGDNIVVVFGARLPEGTKMNSPDLSRNEIVVRLNALADDTRLYILRHIADHGEQRSKEIMSALDLSQSTASRLLTQLCATGFLTVRRCNGAKCYSLAEDRFRDTFQAVLAYLTISP